LEKSSAAPAATVKAAVRNARPSHRFMI
jgi:hypothetical protein